MFDVLKKLVRDEAGQDLAEYGIALAVIPRLSPSGNLGTDLSGNNLPRSSPVSPGPTSATAICIYPEEMGRRHRA